MGKYFIAGALSTAVDALLLYYLVAFTDVHYITSAGVAFVVGVVCSYLFSIFWVFKGYHRHHILLEFSVFVAISVIGLALNQWIIAAFTEDWLTFSKTLSLVIVSIWNFLAKKVFLFNQVK